MEGNIIINIDVMLAKRKMSVTKLAEKVGITLANIVHPEDRKSQGDQTVDPGQTV